MIHSRRLHRAVVQLCSIDRCAGLTRILMNENKNRTKCEQFLSIASLCVCAWSSEELFFPSWVVGIVSLEMHFWKIDEHLEEIHIVAVFTCGFCLSVVLHIVRLYNCVLNKVLKILYSHRMLSTVDERSKAMNFIPTSPILFVSFSLSLFISLCIMSGLHAFIPSNLELIS